jgi:ribonuclease P protein subunit RPR2
MASQQRSRGRKPDYQIRIAKERIEILIGLAEKELRTHPDRSRRYVQLAGKIGMRFNIRFPTNLKRSSCKHCFTPLRPGLTSTQRTDHGVIIVKCQNCQKVSRHPMGKADKKKNNDLKVEKG